MIPPQAALLSAAFRRVQPPYLITRYSAGLTALTPFLPARAMPITHRLRRQGYRTAQRDLHGVVPLRGEMMSHIHHCRLMKRKLA